MSYPAVFHRSHTDFDNLQLAAKLLRDAGRVVVLTGAGMSTPSGIPDFRSETTGLWNYAEPMAVASIWGFREHPQRFYEWIKPLAHKILDAQPNAGHRALARLEKMGRLQTLITQNIDALHQKVGSQRVIELHGHLRTVSCLTCRFQDYADEYLQAFLLAGALPRCPHCNEVLKPDVVLFGEALPDREILTAQEEALRCDLILVAGSSLEVLPAADLPALAVRRGAKFILVNLGVTPYDHLADVILHGDVSEVLPRLVEALAL